MRDVVFPVKQKGGIENEEKIPCLRSIKEGEQRKTMDPLCGGGIDRSAVSTGVGSSCRGSIRWDGDGKNAK